MSFSTVDTHQLTLEDVDTNLDHLDFDPSLWSLSDESYKLNGSNRLILPDEYWVQTLPVMDAPSKQVGSFDQYVFAEQKCGRCKLS